MTKEEAIEVLQKNYPDRCYSMLREAVDIAIEALRNEINCVKCAHYTERETYTGIKGVCKMDTAHMEDLISRREALAGFPEYKNDLGLWTYNTTARAYIKSLPSADVVEVVRCKDCKRYESDGGALMTCTLTDLIVDDDCYCWCGERREP